MAKRFANAQFNQFQQFNVAERDALLHGVVPLMDDWPNRFLNFAGEVGLSQEHFSGASDLHPRWMEEVIYERLRRRDRSVTVAMVANASFAHVESFGSVTRADMQRHFGVSCSKAIDQVLAWRSVGSVEELGQVAIRLVELAIRPQRRASSTYVQVRNAAIVSLAFLQSGDFMDVSGLSNDQIEVVTEPHQEYEFTGSSLFKAIARWLSRRAWQVGKELWPEKLSGDCVCPFIAAKAESGFQRSLRRTLSLSMQGIDAALHRDPRVFHRSLAIRLSDETLRSTSLRKILDES